MARPRKVNLPDSSATQPPPSGAADQDTHPNAPKVEFSAPTTGGTRNNQRQSGNGDNNGGDDTTPRSAFNPDDYDFGGKEDAESDSKVEITSSDVTPEPNTVKTADKTAKISDEMLERAAELGLPEAVAKAFETPEALQKYLENKAGTAIEKKNDAQALDKKEESVLNLAAFDEYPEEVRSTFKAVDEMLKAQKDEISALRSEITKRTSAVELDHVDSAIESIDDEKTFGRGRTSSQREGAETTANRQKLISSAQAIIAGREVLGQAPISMAQAIQNAYKMEFGERASSRQTREITEAVRKREAQFTGRQTAMAAASAESEMSPEHRAIAKGRALLAARGHSSGSQGNSMSRENTAW